MTIKELKEGKPFSFEGNHYRLEDISKDNWIISRQDFFKSYVASVARIGRKKIDCYTYVLGKRVAVSIHIDKCKEVTE